LLLPLAEPLSTLSQAQAAPFGVPFSGPAGLATWHVRQWYGNTRWAYRQRHALYGQGQGLHFGVDFFAPCGTPVLAIGDGVVSAVDGPYGSAPHNLVIRHSNGYASLYGHLGQRSSLRVGQSVHKGDAVGVSSAPSDSDCDTRPHCHLEIRTNGMSGTVNPINLIAADWPNLSLGLSDESLEFELDLDNPERWQTIYDQPSVVFGNALLNNYTHAWSG
jgi:murein DD-endopeptidase MepM/ murein hydrolase activator NlpD